MRRLANYIREREGFDSIIRDEGFASYRIAGEECYIRDIFVEKDYRERGVASEMADDITRIAISKGCNFLTGSVDTTKEGCHASMLILIAYGFKLHSAVPGGVYFRKDI